MEGPSRPVNPRYDLQIGPAAFYGLRLANQEKLPRTSAGRALTPVKVLLEVRAGAPATVSIGSGGTGTATLLYRGSFRVRYHSLSQGDTAVTFTPCPPKEPWRTAHRVVGPRTQFNGGFLLAHAGCVPVVVRSRGRAYRHAVRFGRVRSC